MAKQPIEQNPERYKKKEDKWIISALPESPTKEQTAIIKPLELEVGKPIAKDKLIPLLAVNGIVVKLNDFYILSEQTLSDIEKSDNPHYNIVENGKVLGIPMGKTIPIIEISDANLKAIGNTRDIANKNAGVLEVDYIYETELEMGIPIGLIKQLNYTLSPDISRPADKFKTFDWALQSELNSSAYDITQLKIDTAQSADKSLDTAKMALFLTGVDSRLKTIRQDFNDVKKCFFDAIMPALSTHTWNEIATTDSSNSTDDKPQVVTKESSVVGVNDTPLIAKEKVLKKEQDAIKANVEAAKTSLEQKISQQSDDFQRAQQGDAEAQNRLRQEITETQTATADVYSRYEKLSKGII